MTTLENGVLSYLAGKHNADAQVSITFARSALDRMLLGSATAGDLITAGELQIEGDGAKLATLFGLLDAPDPNFNIVTP